jgi:hypothetical protein
MLVVEVLERYLGYFEGDLVTKDINDGTQLKILQSTKEGQKSVLEAIEACKK